MPDSFEVELRRLVRLVEAAPPEVDISPAAAILSSLVQAESEARRLDTRSIPIDCAFLPAALRAVAFDAGVAGVDLDGFTEAVVCARRALSPNK